jgi:hypothetical protein
LTVQLGEDLVSGLSPGKGLAVLVPTPTEPGDGGGEIGDIGEVAAAQRLAVDDEEEHLLGLLNRSLEGLDGIDLAANGLGGLDRLPGRTASLRVIAIGVLLLC